MSDQKRQPAPPRGRSVPAEDRPASWTPTAPAAPPPGDDPPNLDYLVRRPPARQPARQHVGSDPGLG